MIKLKGKKGKISLLLIFVLLFSLLASSLAMAEIQDSELQEGVVGIQAEEFLEEEPEEEPVEELEEEAKEEPAEQANDEPPVEEPNKEIGEEKATLEVMSAITPLSTTVAQNYFEANGTSTNDHYSAIGVYIDYNDDVHILINELSGGEQYRFVDGFINNVSFINDLDGEKDLEDKTNPISLGTSATIILSDGSTVSASSPHHIWDFNIGPMVGNLQSTNNLFIKNQAGGYDIAIEAFGITLGHRITKEVDEDLATIGDELIYTIKVENTGEFQLTEINVYDDVPEGITIVGVSEDNENWDNDLAYSEDDDIILKEGLTLAVGASKKYYVKAIVNEDAKDGDVIVNTAFTGGSVPREEDTAEVEVEIKLDVTVEKFITGNFGDLSRKFEFIVTINDDEQVGFSLGDKDLKVFEDLQPGDVITLVEESNGYEVTVEVNGKVVDPVDGVYTITLTDQDTAITVTNHKDVVIDTGISLDSLPYILILGLAGGGLGISIVRKRNSYKRD